jgi:hypothetical protein
MALFPNFRMRGVIGATTIRGSKPMKIVRLNQPKLSGSGSALKFSKRTILAGLVLFLSVFQFFRDFRERSFFILMFSIFFGPLVPTSSP